MKKQFMAFLTAVVVAPILAATPALAQETNFVFYGVQFEELEYRFGDEDEKIAAWHADSFIGTDELIIRWKSEGEYDTRADKFEKLENHVDAQVPISEFFDITAGLRLDSPAGPDRWYGSVGFAGLAKQWFEIDAHLFVSEKGDASARLDVEYELVITNHLILIPSAEINVAFSDDKEIDKGSGLTDMEFGLRLSYDLIDRAVSPYFGFVYEGKFGETADIARDEGEDIDAWFVTVGLRLMF